MKRVWRCGTIALAIVGLGVSPLAWAQPPETGSPYPYAATSQGTAGSHAGRAGTWEFGGGPGFMADTPDDTAFAVDLHGDHYLSENVSVGPLGQFAFTDDLAQYAASGQAKYWVGEGPTRMFWQGGAGMVHAAFQKDDTSWLVPVGVGVAHGVSQGVDVYASFLLNFTDLDTGRGTEADLMPGATFGAKF